MLFASSLFFMILDIFSIKLIIKNRFGLILTFANDILTKIISTENKPLRYMANLQQRNCRSSNRESGMLTQP